MFEVSWLVPQHVILIHSIHQITRDELAKGIQKLHQMVHSAYNMVHCIIDNSQLHEIQTTITDILVICAHLPFKGWLLTINSNFEGTQLSNVLSTRHLPRRTEAFSTLQRALCFLQDEDVSLPNLSNYVTPPSLKKNTWQFRQK